MQDPEKTHKRVSIFIKNLPSIPFARSLFKYENKMLEQNILGLNFKNPVGLAGGFDKNAIMIDGLACFGFGFMEFGAVTHRPYAGNPGKKVVRLPKDKALIINYGLMNDGSKIIVQRIKKKYPFVVGINIAKTNDPSIKGEQSVEDYFKTYDLFRKKVSYCTLNISCPNTGDGMTFQEPKLFKNLIKRIKDTEKVCPIFVKLSAEPPKVDQLFEIIKKESLIDGIILTNLSKDRSILKTKVSDEQKGGISGKPVKEKSQKLVEEAYKSFKSKKIIIGCGGIFNAEDAYERIKGGANLLQLVTGFIYGGPFTIKKINQGLVKLLKEDGYSNISDAIGKH